MKRILALILAMTLLLASGAYAANNYNALNNTDILRRGSRGSSVRRLQQALINLGYLSGSADGSYGPMTESAVQNFQWKNGITQNGVATMFTQAALFGDPIPSWSNNRRNGTGSGSYAIRNEDARFWDAYEATLSFDFVNQDYNNVEAICVYYWFADARNRLVPFNNSEYYMQWCYNMNIGTNASQRITQKLSAPKGVWRDMETIRCIVGEIAYTNGSIVIPMNAARQPYENMNYILMHGQ